VAGRAHVSGVLPSGLGGVCYGFAVLRRWLWFSLVFGFVSGAEIWIYRDFRAGCTAWLSSIHVGSCGVCAGGDPLLGS